MCTIAMVEVFCGKNPINNGQMFRLFKEMNIVSLSPSLFFVCSYLSFYHF